MPGTRFRTTGRLKTFNRSGGDSSNRRRPLLVNLTLLLLGGVQGLASFTHVFAGLLHSVPFLLLNRREDWANLRTNVVADGFHFVPRFLTGGLYLRLGLFKNRTDLCLLLGREIERFRHVFERVAPLMMTVPVSARVLLRRFLGTDD
jgi:hypothetical protein